MKIYHNGELIRDGKGRFARKARRSLAVFLLFLAVVAVTSYVTRYKFPNVVLEQVIVEVIPVPTVMARIAKCESDNAHYGKSGQVLMRANNNGTVDVGRYQINTVHFASATAMGLDLTKEADNEAFAMHLYKTQGTEPWYPSKHCWNK